MSVLFEWQISKLYVRDVIMPGISRINLPILSHSSCTLGNIGLDIGLVTLAHTSLPSVVVVCPALMVDTLISFHYTYILKTIYHSIRTHDYSYISYFTLFSTYFVWFGLFGLYPRNGKGSILEPDRGYLHFFRFPLSLFASFLFLSPTSPSHQDSVSALPTISDHSDSHPTLP